jgi:hypothetical protein
MLKVNGYTPCYCTLVYGYHRNLAFTIERVRLFFCVSLLNVIPLTLGRSFLFRPRATDPSIGLLLLRTLTFMRSRCKFFYVIGLLIES